MARLHLAVALTVASLAFVLLITQLYGSFGLPQSITWTVPWLENEDLSDEAPWSCQDAQTKDGEEAEYLLGVGKADITGPIVEINLMGYADPKQLGTGLRQRLYSRAFVIGNLSQPKNRFVYLILDTQSGDTAVRDGILRGLKELGNEYAVYGQSNVAVTGTHSHSGPGAWLNYLLPQITSKGFNNQSYRAIVEGALLSIQRAHESAAPGKLTFGSTEIEDANINRSLYAYLANPKEERQQYKHSVDKVMTMLKFQRSKDGKAIGMLNWFPVHGTSMLGNNTLITGDNKGVAAYLFEKHMREQRSDPSDEFVAGFSQSNVGDTSPNVLGAFCESGPAKGQECRLEDSTCDGRNEPCHGRGPSFGLDDGGTQSCFEIGRRQYDGASALFSSLESATEDTESISGPVSAIHAFRDLSKFAFTLPNGTVVSTCPAALGYSFAAGTTDGPGAFDFKQNNSGEGNANPLWAAVRNFLHEPSEEQIACQAPKPILLDVGETTSPYLWSPNIVDIQLLRVGQLIIIVSPGEATTMAGRRWKDAIAVAAASQTSPQSRNSRGSGSRRKAKPPPVVLGGPANTYTHYITTEQEYAIQRYEGASTLYGPHTLNAYINLTTSLLPHLFSPSEPAFDPGPTPPIYSNKSLSFITPVVRDSSGFTHSFGDLLTDVLPPSKHTYRPGDTATAVFVAANPRNNLRLERTYAAVAREPPSQSSESSFSGPGDLLRPRPRAQSTPFVRTDADWDLFLTWRRTSSALATSQATIVWEIGEDAPPGLYRLLYFGDAKGWGGGVEPLEGVSGVFEVA